MKLTDAEESKKQELISKFEWLQQNLTNFKRSSDKGKLSTAFQYQNWSIVIEPENYLLYIYENVVPATNTLERVLVLVRSTLELEAFGYIDIYNFFDNYDVRMRKAKLNKIDNEGL
jgi:hypothetical protein